MIAYRRGRSVYLNLTNRCPTACSFCVKTEWGWRFEGHDLKLDREPSVEAAAAALAAELNEGPSDEIVFCGFGESVYRLDAMAELSRRARALRPGVSLRLNTVGLGSLIWGRDIAPELAGMVEAVSVSLNSSDPEQWLALHRPAPAYRREGFRAARAFAAACAASGLRTRVTAVALPSIRLAPLRRFAREIGAEFSARPPLVLSLRQRESETPAGRAGMHRSAPPRGTP